MGNRYFTIGFELKSKVAEWYNVDRKTFKAWLDYNTELRDKLFSTGYTGKNKMFTPIQLNLIFKYLGNPENIIEYEETELPKFIAKGELEKLYKADFRTIISYLYRSIKPKVNDRNEFYRYIREINKLSSTKRILSDKDVSFITSLLGKPLKSQNAGAKSQNTGLNHKIRD